MKNATLIWRIRQVRAAKMAVIPDGEEWLGFLELPGLNLLWRGREAKWFDLAPFAAGRIVGSGKKKQWYRRFDFLVTVCVVCPIANWSQAMIVADAGDYFVRF